MSKITLSDEQVTLIATRFLDYQLLDTRDENDNYISWNEVFTGEQICPADAVKLRQEIESFIEGNPVTVGGFLERLTLDEFLEEYMAARILEAENNDGFISRSNGAYANTWNDTMQELRTLVMEKPAIDLDSKMVRTGNNKSWGIKF